MSSLNGARFGHVGGSVFADHGALSLTQARTLVVFYAREAEASMARGEAAAARLCARRALALHAAAEGAALWRRAAGWRDPEAADRSGPIPPPAPERGRR